MNQPEPQNLLNGENYSQGFLVDDELMAGITTDPNQTDPNAPFVAFVLRHTTGEYIGYQTFPTLQPALDTLNRIPRNWTFEQVGGCGGNCGSEGGTCAKKGSCKVGKCGTGKC